MLSKLMKYEIGATERIFLPLYGLIIAFSLINKIFISSNVNNLHGFAMLPFIITMSVYCILIAALIVMTLVVTIQRFYKNLLGDEGYLSFTLPVKIHNHIDCKMIITLMWTVLSLIVSALSVFLLSVNKDNIKYFSNGCMEIAKFFREYGIMAYGLLAEGIILMAVSILAGILQIYASIAVGNLSSKHKLLVGFGVFIGFGILQQIVMSTILEITRFNAFNIYEIYGTGTLQSFGVTAAAMGFSILFAAAFGVAFYFFTNWMLSKKLNLE